MLDFEVGDVIADRYEIKKVLGVGGMGKVFLAKQLELGRDVALKVPSQAVLGNPEVMARFSREAKTVGKLMHDNIVQVYEYYHEQNLAFIAMEFVQGEDLKNFVVKPPKDITVGDVATILEMSCEGIACAHDHGIIHRDIKPHNIMVGRQKRGKWRVKVMDFGIAHIDATGQFTEVGDGQLTQTGQALGTPSYMAPEQIRGSGVSKLSDIYSFGCVIYYVFTRKTIFSGSGLTVAVSHLNEQPPSILSQLPKLPVELDRLVNECLEKDPAARPQEANEVGSRLTEALRSIWDQPMTEFWKETLQSPNSMIPLAGMSPLDKTVDDSDTSNEPSGKLITVNTQGTIGRTGMTDDDLGPDGTLVDHQVDHTNDATLPSQSAVKQTAPSAPDIKPGRRFPAKPATSTPSVSVAKPAAASQEAVGTMVMPALSESVVNTPKLDTQTTPAPAGLNKSKAALIIGGLGLGAVVLGVGLATMLGGGKEETPVAQPTVAPSVSPTAAPVIATEVPTGTEVAAVLQPTPKAVETEATPAPTPAVQATPEPTPRPTPSPTPSKLEINSVTLKIFRGQAETEKNPLLLASLWSSIMELHVEGEEAFNEEVQKLANDVALRMAILPEMISLESFRFTMGREEGASDERPIRSIQLSGFDIGKYEVTALEFATFLNNNSIRAETLFIPEEKFNVEYDAELKLYRPKEGRENHPANGVSWNAAVAYTEWLRKETGKLYRLPTEAEWEGAARGRQPRNYPWGDSAPNSSQANFNNTQTVNVDAFAASFNTLHNVTGNVAEWVQDWYDDQSYTGTELQNPQGPSDSEATSKALIRKVIRGGSYLSNSDGLIVTSRSREKPDSQREDIGFRLALTPSRN
ncbi:MAG: SUMF1/EgtB/PvdO family nonheme iron enzyme [Candidatus Sumerlaeia bacterium]|nr:SUMF1/EgtB/PvdO family nonheme iron enzyme [Candidatus Sumerlaeia bacterium]